MGPQLRMDDNVCSLHQQDQECISMSGERDGNRNRLNLLLEFERWRRENGSIQCRNKWRAMLFGQCVAVVSTSMNATSYILEYGMHRVFPMFLLFCSYMILFLYYFEGIWCSDKKNKEYSLVATSACRALENDTDAHIYRLPLTRLKLRTPWYYYLFLSFLDIGPNYLALLAMNKTSFTSATLLGSLTIPSTMIFCRLLLGKEYRWIHYAGVILCILGGTTTVLTDRVRTSISTGETAHPHPHSFGGDILAILASLGYGAGDACAEFWSKHVNREEYLGMIGFFGAIFTFILSLLYEQDPVLDLFASENENILQSVGFIIWYIASLVAYYVFASLFLEKSDATLLNLSLQMSNFWAILFSVVVFREIPNFHLYVSIFMVISGVFVYELLGNDEKTKEASNGCNATESSLLNSGGQSSCYTADMP